MEIRFKHDSEISKELLALFSEEKTLQIRLDQVETNKINFIHREFPFLIGRKWKFDKIRLAINVEDVWWAEDNANLRKEETPIVEYTPNTVKVKGFAITKDKAIHPTYTPEVLGAMEDWIIARKPDICPFWSIGKKPHVCNDIFGLTIRLDEGGFCQNLGFKRTCPCSYFTIDFVIKRAKATIEKYKTCHA